VQAHQTQAEIKPATTRKNKIILLLVIAACAAPMIFSYLTYYVIKPETRTNYGALIDPRAHPIPQLSLKTLDGHAADLNQFKGKWIFLMTDAAACDKACAEKLFYMRQIRLTQGKEMDRIERVWLITDTAPLETILMREYDGTHLLRAKNDELRAWLPTDSETKIEDHLYMIDPLGNLMMRFPKASDPNKIKKDVIKLLKASRIG
jgi:glutathione peroxidase-family protein